MKKFYGWPQLMGHISQQACPVLRFGEATALAAPAAETHADPVPTIVAREDNNPDTTFSVSTVPAPELVAASGHTAQRASAPSRVEDAALQQSEPPVAQRPLFERPEFVSLARQKTVKDLARAIVVSKEVQHCPHCYQWCAQSTYVARHACKMHSDIRQQQHAVQLWIKRQVPPLNPCEWCLERYRTPPGVHQNIRSSNGGTGRPGALHGSTVSEVGSGRCRVRGQPGHRARGHGSGSGQAACAAEDSQSKPKWAKGEAKGDPQASEQPAPSTPASTGKGRTAAPQTLPGQGQSGVASTTAPAEGTVDHPRRQRTQRQWGDQTWWGKDKRDHRSGIREDRFHDRDNSELRELVKAMFIIFMQTKEAAKGWSITASLYKVAQAWHKQKKEAPATLTQPLRTILFHCFLTSLRSRLQEMEENQELLLKAKELGLIEAQSYLYLTWSQEEKKYIKDSMDPLDHVDAVRMLNLMIQLSSFPDTVGRFHALRPLSAEHRSEVLPFLLEIQSRTPEANQLYLQLRRLCRNGALHLIGATMRPSKIGRSPLALQVDRLLQSL